MNQMADQLSDDTLIHMLKINSNEALAEIYNRYWKTLFVAAANKLGSLEEAENIVQQIFVNMWLQRDKLEISTPLPSYLAAEVKCRILKRILVRSKNKSIDDENGDTQKDYKDLPDDASQDPTVMPFQKGRIIYLKNSDDSDNLNSTP
ncbi:RNA polymerase sigma factor [Sphingobacterium sp. SYP-B4668]|uniref:RNA polymerase sigma factor n=1 Tax=Sphingobacterium sp. SYP-B4668 TaxID=2996035 RepID=UPI0022DE1584|nr:hypothetical protein [Sphingobacterium sp. SYP-B4668]